MTRYNLYSSEGLLNSRPLTTQEVVDIMNKQVVYKKNKYTGKLTEVPTKSIRVIKTIIV